MYKRQVLGLAQGPNQLGHRRHRGHVPALNDPLFQNPLAGLVDGEVAGLVEALAADHHRDAGLGHLLQLAHQVSVDEVQPADAEGLDDDAAVVHPQQHVEDVRVEAGGQLDEDDPAERCRRDRD